MAVQRTGARCALAFALLLALGPLQAPAQATDLAAIEAAVDSAYKRFASVDEGETAQYIPALAAADPDRFGIYVMTVDGEVVQRGDTQVPFAIMSAAKPFTLALLLRQKGPEFVLERIGVEPTGLPFNSLEGVERARREPMNPLVNAGAITTVSLLQVEQPEQRWPLILDYYGEFAGEPLTLMGDVYKSVGESNYRNRALVNLLQVEGWLDADPVSTLDVYNKQSCVAVNAGQLAAMGATLANGGTNPRTGKRVLESSLVEEVLALMTLSGFYDESGWWAFTAGLPAKSGVGGGIVAVVPGRMAVATYSPRLSEAGNSVRGMLAIQALSAELGLSIFATP